MNSDFLVCVAFTPNASDRTNPGTAKRKNSLVTFAYLQLRIRAVLCDVDVCVIF